MKPKSKIPYYILAHLSAGMASLIAGTSFVLTSLIMKTMEPAEATLIRYFFAFLCVSPFFFISVGKVRKIPLNDLTAIVILGFLFYFTFPMTFNWGLQWTSASQGALIVSTLPILSLLLGSFLKVEKLNRYKSIGCLIAIVGVGVGVSNSSSDLNPPEKLFSGNLIMFLAVCQAAIFSVFARKYFQIYGAWLVSIIAITVGFAIPAPFIISSYGFESIVNFDGHELIYLFILGTLGVPIQFGLFSWSIIRLGPSRATLYLVLTPIPASMLAVFTLNENLSLTFALGLILVTLAIFVANRRDE